MLSGTSLRKFLFFVLLTVLHVFCLHSFLYFIAIAAATGSASRTPAPKPDDTQATIQGNETTAPNRESRKRPHSPEADCSSHQALKQVRSSAVVSEYETSPTQPPSQDRAFAALIPNFQTTSPGKKRRLFDAKSFEKEWQKLNDELKAREVAWKAIYEGRRNRLTADQRQKLVTHSLPKIESRASSIFDKNKRYWDPEHDVRFWRI